MDKKTEKRFDALEKLIVEGFITVNKDYKELSQFVGAQLETKASKAEVEEIVERVVSEKTEEIVDRVVGEKTEEIVERVIGKKTEEIVDRVVGAKTEEIVERAVGKKMDKMLTILDGQSKHFQEQEMIKVQLKRHEGWIKDIAQNTKTKLEY